MTSQAGGETGDGGWPVRILGRRDIRSAVEMGEAIEAMRSAFPRISNGRARVPQRLVLSAPCGESLFMPGFLEEGPALGGKVVSVFPGNADLDLPVTPGVVLLLDPQTGAPAAVMDGTYLTTLRTGAASGLATDVLARPDSEVLTIFGAATQARGQLEGVLSVRCVREIRITSRSRRSAERFAREISGGRVRVLEDPREAVEGADVIVTVTDSETPVFPGRTVQPGTHVNAIGSYRPDMRELDAHLPSRARIVVDSRETAWEEAGELVQARREGVVEYEDVQLELGEIVSGEKQGR